MNQTCPTCGGSLYRFQERVYCPICNPQANPESPAVNRLTRTEAEEKIALLIYGENVETMDNCEDTAKELVSALLGDCLGVLIEEKTTPSHSSAPAKPHTP